MDSFREQTDQEVENKLWFEKFDAALPEFTWFIEKHFKPECKEVMMHLRKEEDIKMLKYMLWQIWFYLPDNEFNIIVNPKGWHEFLSLIEE